MKGESFMAQKKELSLVELIESHRPKNFKYYYDIKNDTDLIELDQLKYDLSTLDTIGNSELIHAAKNAGYKYYERDIVSHAKEPTVLENGVLLTKKMATKTDKKLSQVGVGYFTMNDVSYVAVKLCYERFDIYEIFILT